MKNKLVFVLASLLTLGAVLLPTACNFERDSTETVLPHKQAVASQGLEPDLDWETFVAYRPATGCCAFRLRFMTSSPPTLAESEFLQNGRVVISTFCTDIYDNCLNGLVSQIVVNEPCSRFHHSAGWANVCGPFCITYYEDCSPGAAILHRVWIASKSCSVPPCDYNVVEQCDQCPNADQYVQL